MPGYGGLAQRFADEPFAPTIIGYDLMNEPFPGSSASASQMLLFEKGAEMLANWSGPPGPRPKNWPCSGSIPQARPDPPPPGRCRSFSSVIDVTRSIYNDFEQNQLRTFYQRVARAIRQVDAHKIIFLETSMGSNMGVYSGLSDWEYQEVARSPAGLCPARLRPGSGHRRQRRS